MDDWLMNRRQQELDETEHTRNTTTLIDRHTDEEKVEEGGEELPRVLSYSELTAVDGTDEDCQSLLLDSSNRTPNDTDKQHTTNYGSTIYMRREVAIATQSYHFKGVLHIVCQQ